MPSREEVTRLLAQWSAGDTSAMDELMPLVYDLSYDEVKAFMDKKDWNPVDHHGK